MEKFINNLYSNSNFPIILISLIAIFIVLFIITLILALKDAKNNSEEEISLKNEEENKDKVVFKEPVKEEKEETKESNVFEDVSFDKEETKEDNSVSNNISFQEPLTVPEAEEENVDVIEETTQTIPVLKEEEISNFEEFFFQNLKDKDNNIFDFSKPETKEEEKQEDNSINDINESSKVNNDITPNTFEMPKMKKEYTFKELDGETYRLK